MRAISAMSLVLLFGVSLAWGVGAEEPQEIATRQDKRPPEEIVPDFARSLIGSWENDDDNESVIHFEATKCTFARLGKPTLQIARLTYEPGRIVTNSLGREVVIRFELKDRVLSLTWPDGKPKKYLKLDKVPAEVEAKPLALGEAKELPKEKVQTVQGELARRAKLDQEVRTDPAKRNEAGKVDADNTNYVVKLVQEVGWIDAERFGARTSNDAFLIVQHSMHAPLMLAALPAIEKDVKAKRLNGQPYALLHDRLQLMLGEKQRYGTQIGPNDNGELVVLPLEDRRRVEELRKEIGLFSLADYLKFYEMSQGKPVKFPDDE